ncbi:GNAT family N-acetyltransferase [Nocardia sp. NPDC004711]
MREHTLRQQALEIIDHYSRIRHCRRCCRRWGWPLPPAVAWWGGLHLDDPSADHDQFIREDGRKTFALSEIQRFTGRGYARALHDALVADRSEARIALLVEPGNTRAYAEYRRWGYKKVGTLKPSWPDSPVFNVLVNKLR